MKNKIIIFIILCFLLVGCKEKTYTITFNTDGGSLMNNVILKEGDNLTNIAPPTKEGYLFVKWEKDGRTYDLEEPIKEDTNLTAKWIETPQILNNYTIIFISNGYEEKTTVRENELVPELKPNEKENYTFIGWYLGDQKYDFNSKVTKDLVLTAKYEINTVTITYDLDGGTGLSNQEVPIGSTPEIPPIPIREGHRFLKWALNNQEFSFDTIVTEDIIVKAIWDEIEYITITYDTSGGNEIKPTILEKYSRITKLPIPEKDGCIFIEWQLNEKSFDLDTEINTDITLKAIYKKG